MNHELPLFGKKKVKWHWKDVITNRIKLHEKLREEVYGKRDLAGDSKHGRKI